MPHGGAEFWRFKDTRPEISSNTDWRTSATKVARDPVDIVQKALVDVLENA